MNNNMFPRNINSQFQLNYNVVNHSPSIEDERFPEVYRILHPIVSQIIADMENHYGNIQMSDEVLESMSEIAIQRSGLLEQVQQFSMQDMTANLSPLDSTDLPEAIPTANMNFGGRRRWDRRNDGHWGNHNRSTLNDIAKILLLQQLFGGRRPRWRW